LKLSQKERDKIKVLVGHFPFGLHEHLNGDFQYVTFMREPVERVLSAYFYNKGNQSSDVYDAINENNLNIEEYLDRNIEPWSNNAMTKHFAGCSLEEFKMECTEELFLKAKSNLLNCCIAVGLTEEFDKSLLVLKSVLNWSPPKYERKNITPVKKSKQEIDEQTIDRIKSINKYDVQLYRLGVELFSKQYDSLPHPERDLKKS
jgi:hypothetical protein